MAKTTAKTTAKTNPIRTITPKSAPISAAVPLAPAPTPVVPPAPATTRAVWAWPSKEDVPLKTAMGKDILTRECPACHWRTKMQDKTCANPACGHVEPRRSRAGIPRGTRRGHAPLTFGDRLLEIARIREEMSADIKRVELYMSQYDDAMQALAYLDSVEDLVEHCGGFFAVRAAIRSIAKIEDDIEDDTEDTDTDEAGE